MDGNQIIPLYTSRAYLVGAKACVSQTSSLLSPGESKMAPSNARLLVSPTKDSDQRSYKKHHVTSPLQMEMHG